jgi:crotonobetainyl-CoA:carnitine CoA-transferase CaiB-like acyl-CoA transferase
MVNAPLSGVVVVDLSSDIAGAYCTKTLADGGAEVIKLEPPAGDPLRRWAIGRDLGADETGALFEFLGCSKRSVVVDADDPSDLSLVHSLLRSADAIIWTPGTVLAQRFDPNQLRNLAPAAVVCAITPYGLDGPWADRAAAEMTLQAWSGGIFGRGRPSHPPVHVGGRPGLWMAGICAAVGVLAARSRAEERGIGDLLDVSMLDALTLTSHMYPVTISSARESLGISPPPPRPRSIPIPAIHRALDGWVGLMVVTATMWDSFCLMVDHPEWRDDDSLYGYSGRRARRRELETAIDEWAANNTVEDILEKAALLRVPAAPVSNGRTVTEVEHFKARGFYQPNPRTGFLQPTPPYRFHGSLDTVRPVAAPLLGEHTEHERRRVRNQKRIAAEPEPPGLPLEGLRIADFTAFWAGPIVGHFFAMLGAEVIHVESPRHPDGMRGHSLRGVDEEQWWEYTPVFHGPNTNKFGVTIDMNLDEGKELARKLIAKCDILIENFSPRVIEQWGLHYDALRDIRPDLIVLRMPAFGLSGPWRDRTGYAQNMEQISGLAWVTGSPDGPPQAPNGMCDPLAGTHATAALLMALEHRRRTGEGCQIEAPMVCSALNITAEQALEYQAYGHLLERDGNQGLDAPHNLYLANDVDELGQRDVWVAIAVETDGHWQALQDGLGHPTWSSATSLKSADGRRAARDLLDAELSAWCARRSSAEIVATLWEAGVPVGVVTDPGQAHRLIHHQVRSTYQTLNHPLCGEELHMGYPVRMSEGPQDFHRRPAPLLGEHNGRVFEGVLGLDADEMAGLVAHGVIAERLIR